MSLTIALCGDIILGRRVAEYIGASTLVDYLGGVAPAWGDADVVIGNLEGPCVSMAKPINGPLPELILYAGAGRIEELASAGFLAVTLANNHILDCGPLGLKETIQALRRAGFYYAGAGMNLAEALQPAFIPVGDVTVGLVSFCYGPPAGKSSPGAAPCDFKSMQKGLQAARAGADVVIAALHDGLEYSDVPPARTRGRFHFLAENGADIVMGHHPHVLQGLEWWNGVPILYSLGDLLSDNSLPEVAKSNFSRMAMGLYAKAEIQRDAEKFSRGAVVTVSISETKKSVQWHPFRQTRDLRPQLSTNKTRVADLEKLEGLSRLTF
jgi:poly-gamma-glutamate synthesis protein (capsule biosynthesis protein)